ncbi:MAG TPA: GNAT family protein [Ktedonobacterales bacterium]|nr:GNAT family protein [Ktedonobacterales bacterium]
MDLPRYLTLIPLPDELRGARVVLRPYRAEDAHALFEAIEESRQHLAPWMLWVAHHRSILESQDFIAHSCARWLLRDELNMAIWEAASGRYLGSTGLHGIDWHLRRFEIGYWLRRTAEGHGYMTEAAGLLADFALDTLGANRVEIRCDARNLRSAAVAERLGFIREACLRNAEHAPDGTLRDTLIYALTPADREAAPQPA